MKPWAEIDGKFYLADEPLSREFPESWIIYCPECGTVWGRVFSGDPKGKWWSRELNCKKCGPDRWENTGGSIEELFPYLPPELWKREANLEIERWLKSRSKDSKSSYKETPEQGKLIPSEPSSILD